MKIHRVMRTISFRLAALYASLFLFSMLILFGIVYVISTSALRDYYQLSLESEANGKSTYPSLDALAAEIDRRISIDGPRRFMYSLHDHTGAPIAGDLHDLELFTGLREINVSQRWTPDATTETKRLFLALGTVLPTGGHLIVAQNTDQLDALKNRVALAFLWSGGLAIAIALAGGIILSRGFLRRVEQINLTTRRIMAGDLSGRILIRGTGDELDELGENLNEMLNRLQKLMEGLKQVSNDIAHDLKTPLTRLIQRLESAQVEASSAAEYKEYVSLALQDAATAMSIFSALLRISQIESSTRLSSFRALDLSELLSSLCMTYSAVAEDAHKALTADITDHIIVRGDRELLTQLFVNLIENALHHTQRGAKIKVTLNLAAQDDATVEIADNGPGIPAPERVNVFKRFYRLESSRTTPGNGLGLSLAAAIAELHGANIVLDDNAPGLKVVMRFKSIRPSS